MSPFGVVLRENSGPAGARVDTFWMHWPCTGLVAESGTLVRKILCFDRRRSLTFVGRDMGRLKTQGHAGLVIGPVRSKLLLPNDYWRTGPRFTADVPRHV